MWNESIDVGDVLDRLRATSTTGGLAGHPGDECHVEHVPNHRSVFTPAHAQSGLQSLPSTWTAALYSTVAEMQEALGAKVSPYGLDLEVFRTGNSPSLSEQLPSTGGTSPGQTLPSESDESYAELDNAVPGFTRDIRNEVHRSLLKRYYKTLRRGQARGELINSADVTKFSSAKLLTSDLERRSHTPAQYESALTKVAGRDKYPDLDAVIARIRAPGWSPPNTLGKLGELLNELPTRAHQTAVVELIRGMKFPIDRASDFLRDQVGVNLRPPASAPKLGALTWPKHVNVLNAYLPGNAISGSARATARSHIRGLMRHYETTSEQDSPDQPQSILAWIKRLDDAQWNAVKKKAKGLRSMDNSASRTVDVFYRNLDDFRFSARRLSEDQIRDVEAGGPWPGERGPAKQDLPINPAAPSNGDALAGPRAAVPPQAGWAPLRAQPEGPGTWTRK